MSTSMEQRSNRRSTHTYVNTCSCPPTGRAGKTCRSLNGKHASLSVPSAGLLDGRRAKERRERRGSQSYCLSRISSLHQEDVSGTRAMNEGMGTMNGCHIITTLCLNASSGGEVPRGDVGGGGGERHPELESIDFTA